MTKFLGIDLPTSKYGYVKVIVAQLNLDPDPDLVESRNIK